MLDKFRIKITIFATLIVTIYCFFSNTSFLKTGYSIIFTIIIFYFLAGIAELTLKEYIEKSKKPEESQILKEDEIFEDEDLNIDQNFEHLGEVYSEESF